MAKGCHQIADQNQLLAGVNFTGGIAQLAQGQAAAGQALLNRQALIHAELGL